MEASNLTRTIEVRLGSAEIADAYDRAVDGSDEDVLLQVEKAIISTLYPDRIVTGGLSGTSVDLDPDVIEVLPGS